MKLLSFLLIFSIWLISSNFSHAKSPMCVEAVERSKDKEILLSRKTKNGITLKKILSSGTVNQDSSIGCYAGDADSYDQFSEIFDYIVRNYHHKKPESYYLKKDKKIREKLTSDARKLIKSTRIRVARNFDKYPFTSSMTKEERLNLEQQMINLFKGDKNFKSGKYFKISEMNQNEIENLVKNHLLFKDMTTDKYIRAAGIADDYPFGRGIFISKDKNSIIWVNEEDHLRIISIREDSEVNKVFSNLVKLEKIINKKIKFAKNDRYGFLTSCPTNIGTGMRASFHVRLKNLGKDEVLLKQLARKLRLDVRGENGEHTQSEEMIFDISNKERIGSSMEDYINNLIHGVNLLVQFDSMIKG